MIVYRAVCCRVWRCHQLLLLLRLLLLCVFVMTPCCADAAWRSLLLAHLFVRSFGRSIKEASARSLSRSCAQLCSHYAPNRSLVRIIRRRCCRRCGASVCLIVVVYRCPVHRRTSSTLCFRSDPLQQLFETCKVLSATRSAIFFGFVQQGNETYQNTFFCDDFSSQVYALLIGQVFVGCWLYVDASCCYDINFVFLLATAHIA